MKNVLLFVMLCLFYSTAFSQFTIRGTVEHVNGQRYLYLNKLSKITAAGKFVDSIAISPGKPFSHTVTNFDSSDLYQLVLPPQTDVEQFPENGVLFSMKEGGEIELLIRSVHELYNYQVLKGSDENRYVSGQLSQQLAPYFAVVNSMNSSASPKEKDSLIEKVMEFQFSFINSIHTVITNSNDPQILIPALYMLAKLYHGSGQGNFTGYYNTVKSMLPETELTMEFDKIAKQPVFDIDFNQIKNLPLLGIKGEAVTNLSNQLTTNYLLIDYWASWCGPCRRANQRELPELVAQYRGNAEVGFISISVDTDVDKWKKASGEDKLSWNNYRAGRQDNSPLPDFLNGRGIPFYILLSRTGTVLQTTNNASQMREYMKRIIK